MISTPRFIEAMAGTGAISTGGACRAFDAAADGFVCGEGAGAVVLKRLSEALRDGDVIHGVIAGSGINQDGRTNGLTAPSAPAQAALQTDVYRAAGIDPGEIGYVEAHGTGTILGDPIEVEGLTQAFRGWTQGRGFCALGSVKANIGHTLTAAGIAGLLKLLLMRRHGVIPPQPHYAVPNPRLGLDETPFHVSLARSPFGLWTGLGLRSVRSGSAGRTRTWCSIRRRVGRCGSLFCAGSGTSCCRRVPSGRCGGRRVPWPPI